jgi:DNA-binding MarR family transcriptional regulator
MSKSRLSRPQPARNATAHQREASPARPFPPLTTSLKTFVKNGSDREFRILIYDLIKLSNQLTRNRKYFASYMGVTEAQWLMIMIIAETGPTTVGHLAQQLNLSSPFVTMEIGDLVKKNVVEKRPNETDRRSMFLNLTPRGKDLLCEVAPMLQRGNDIMFRSLTEERAKALKDMVRALLADGAIALHALESPEWLGKTAPSAEPERSPSRKPR